MFHTAQWSSNHSSATPSLSSIQIWAHLTGVPLNLRHQKGLSLVAGLVGDPKETDDFTLNLVNLTLSHVKVELDLTKPVPNVVEFQRQSGEVVEVQVSYPWLPPTCSNCKELGHVVRNCLHYIPPPPGPAPPTTEKVQKQKQKAQVNPTPKKQPLGAPKNKQYVAVKKTLPSVVTTPSNPSPLQHTNPAPSSLPAASVSLPSSPLVPKTPKTVFSVALNTDQSTHKSPSDKPQRPSLKRSRSSPTLSPPTHPKLLYQSSSSSSSKIPPPFFPKIGTMQYVMQSPFISAPTSNPFLPLLSVDSLQPSGDPPTSSQ